MKKISSVIAFSFFIASAICFSLFLSTKLIKAFGVDVLGILIYPVGLVGLVMFALVFRPVVVVKSRNKRAHIIMSWYHLTRSVVGLLLSIYALLVFTKDFGHQVLFRVSDYMFISTGIWLLMIGLVWRLLALIYSNKTNHWLRGWPIQ